MDIATGCSSGAVIVSGTPSNRPEIPTLAPVAGPAARVARWVSVLAHPFVMIFVMVGTGTACASGSENVWRNAGMVALFVIVPVTILTVRQVRTGHDRTKQLSESRHRESMRLDEAVDPLPPLPPPGSVLLL